jgi:micrococcal nuclease
VNVRSPRHAFPTRFGEHRSQAPAAGFGARCRRAHALFRLAAILSASLVSACTVQPPDSGRRQPQQWTTFAAARTLRVVDGDTLDVDLEGRFVRIRTVQIDAPESSATRYGHPDRCGAAATRFADTLTRPSGPITLQLAATRRTDAYARLLAIVRLGGPHALTWQERMVRSGWAEVVVYGRDITPLLSQLHRDAAYAQAHRLGVWATCGGRFHDHP